MDSTTIFFSINTQIYKLSMETMNQVAFTSMPHKASHSTLPTVVIQ